MPLEAAQARRVKLHERQTRFEEMFRSHRGRVLAFALRRTGPEEARDVTAETFLVAWRRLEDVPSDALPWLLGVARKVLSTHARSERRWSNLQERLAGASPEQRSADPAPAVADSLRLAGALNELSNRDREALLLVAWDGLKVSEAARVLGCSSAIFSLRLHRARKRLARQLSDEDAPFLSQQPIATEEAR